MACPRCQKVTSDNDYIICRGYCGASFHTFCAKVDQPALETLKQYDQNIFWMCDDCASLFSNGHFRNLASRCGVDHASPNTDAINSLKDDLEKLNQAVKSLTAKVDSQPKTPAGSLKFQYNDVLKTPFSSKRRRISENSTPQVVTRPVNNRGTSKTLCESVKTVQLKDDLFWIYLSAFDPSTTDDEIVEFVRKCLNISIEQPIPKVVKLVSKVRDVSTMRFVSFKVGVAKSLSEIALCADSWPENIYFREFENRPKNVPPIVKINMNPNPPAKDVETTSAVPLDQQSQQ